MELELHNVTKQYRKQRAVSHVSLTLDKGIHALLGANGSGKTTLIRMICGILTPTQGDILHHGCSIRKQYDSYCDHLGYMPQHFGFYPNYTVKEFLDYMSIVKRIPKDKADKNIDHWLHKLNMQDAAHKKMKHLSGGMLKRVGIVQALLNSPDILILDEPTAGLDPKERIVFRNLIASLSTQCLVLISTHIVSDIETIADDIIVMKKGEILMQDTCEQLLYSMRDKVWEVHVEEGVADKLASEHHIVKSHHVKDGVDLRIVSDQKPLPDAVSVKPDLDDFYLYHFHDEGETI